jgi:hypothetical protein
MSLPIKAETTVGLLGGILRFNALNTEQHGAFTAVQLAQHAGTDPETARAFLDKLGSLAHSGNEDLDARLYRIRGDKKNDVIGLLAKAMQARDLAEGVPPPTPEERRVSLDMFATSVKELAQPQTLDRWNELWRDVRRESASLKADIAYMRQNGDSDAEAFSLEFRELRKQLVGIKRTGLENLKRPRFKVPREEGALPRPAVTITLTASDS